MYSDNISCENQDNIHKNILFLRRNSNLSQKEFINLYLTNCDNKPIVSTGTYSNFENNGGKSTLKISKSIAQKLNLDYKVFEQNPEVFIENISEITKNSDISLPDLLETSAKSKDNGTYTSSLVRIISDYLTDGILTGKLKPKDKLPSDRELAEKFQVGRSTIREALKVIALIGLVEIRAGQGTFVASEPSDFFITPLSWTLVLGQKSIADVIDMRNILELGSIRLAAQCQEEDLLSELSALMDNMGKAYKNNDYNSFFENDLEFHLILAKCAKNQIIFELLHTSRKLLTLICSGGFKTIADIESMYREHLALYEAIIKHDSDLAEKKMREHLEGSSHRYLYNYQLKK